MIYGVLVCRYTFSGPLVLAFLLLTPAVIWQLLERYCAACVASLALIPWVVWENHIQCLSDAGPFVGGLGPIYVILFGLFTSVIVGTIFSFVDRRRRNSYL